jgi:biopolymer transport protein ExbB
MSHFNWIEALTTSPISLVLLGFSVLTLGTALERAMFYWKRRGNPDTTLARILENLRGGDRRQATWLCRETAHPMGPACEQAIASGPSERAFEERLQICLSEQKLLLERNLGILGTMAAVAPLVGLLGTVWGIMRAFGDMALAGSAAPSVVAAGVAEALVTTAAGLVVAVPALMIYNHFIRRMNVMLTVAENQARSIRTTVEADGGPGDTGERQAA